MAVQQPQLDGMTLRVTADTHSEVVAQIANGPAPKVGQNEPFVVSSSDNEKKQETQRQAWFENSIKKKLKIPNSYVQVAPLIIRWDPEIDEYSRGHDCEIKDLKAVFDRFGFSSSTEVCLNTKDQKPQNTLNSAITAHIAQNDGPNKLMIIYYTGHGILDTSDGEGKLMFAATLDDDDRPEGEHEATAYWWKAEAPLLDDSVDADVLAIFDCCFASDVKGCQDSRRIYDLLAACPKGAFTPAPGPESFSRRLVETLNRLLDEDADQRILTTRLLEEMNMRYHTPAKLHDRLHKDDGRHVQLRPISGQSKQKTEKDAKNFSLRPMEEAGVKLRFSLQTRELSKKKIEAWAQHLIKACDAASIPLRRIDWIKMEERHPKQMFRHAVKQVRRSLRRRSIQSDSNSEAPTSPTRKRSRSASRSPTLAKRRLRANSRNPDSHLVSGLLTPDTSREDPDLQS